MKRNEKFMLAIAGVLFVLVLTVRVVPMVYNYYQQGEEEIALLEARIDRYRQLIVDTELWMEREKLKEAEIADLQNWVFEGSNPNLVGSSVQRTLRQAMEQVNVVVRETDVARYNTIGNWLMVSQEMNFVLSEDQILPFLNALREMRPRLYVTAFTVNRNRREFTGSITVTGFSRTE